MAPASVLRAKRWCPCRLLRITTEIVDFLALSIALALITVLVSPPANGNSFCIAGHEVVSLPAAAHDR
jgi:hypothetical protein